MDPFSTYSFPAIYTPDVLLNNGEVNREHQQLNGHEFEQTLGDSEGQGSRAYYSPWGCKEWDMT